MGTRRSPRRWPLVLGTATILALLALAPAPTVQPGLAKAVAAPGLSAPPGAWVAEVEPNVAFSAAETAAPVPAELSPPDIPAESAPPPALEPDPCADALAWVEGTGLVLPPGVAYHCPSTLFAHQGAACWYGTPCRGGGLIAINMDLLQGTSTDYLRHVVAHEVCHILDFQSAGRTTEAGADACAAAHGAPA